MSRNAQLVSFSAITVLMLAAILLLLSGGSWPVALFASVMAIISALRTYGAWVRWPGSGA